MTQDTDPRTGFSTGAPLTAEVLTIYLAVGLVDFTVPYLLPLLRLFRQMSYHSDVAASLETSVVAASLRKVLLYSTSLVTRVCWLLQCLC